MPKILVCPVAYNEHVKLRNVIERFLRSPVRGQADYLIVDDGSDDGSEQMIHGYAGEGVATLRHPQRKGVGSAIRTKISAIDAAPITPVGMGMRSLSSWPAMIKTSHVKFPAWSTRW